MSNVDISSDTTLNVTLDVGFVLSGTINAPPGEQPVSISAVGSGGNVFQGAINPQTNAYQIFVAGDTYTLTTCFTIGPLGPTSTFNDPTQIVVTGTTSYDTTLPTITAFNVSGTVSGINPASFNSIMFSASDNSSSGSFMIAPDGSYSGKLPNGNYNVAVSALSFITFQQSTSVAGSLVVNGSDTTGNFSVPSLATLSGVVVRPDGPIPPNSIITASDVTAQGGSSCVAQVTNSGFAQINPASGGYGLTLAKGHTYNVGVALPVVPAAPPQSMGFFVFTTTIDLADDGTAEIDVPALPNMATVSGLVSGPDGNPLTMIPVVGIAQGLSGTPNASFSRGTSTNMTGVYSLTVLSSSSYTLGFIPGTPPPQ